MRRSGVPLLLLSALLAGPGPMPAWGNSSEAGSSAFADLDPLRRFLPPDDLYMQVPGGVLAVEKLVDPSAGVEQQAQGRDGGLIVGYCLRSSCSRVTHLAVLQVCSNQIGGPEGTDQLILGIVRLPYGDAPGYLHSLEGWDYAANFADHGPIVQALAQDRRGKEVEALQALSAEGLGPVASPFLAGGTGQSLDSLALHLVPPPDPSLGVQGSRFEVRHLCQKPIS